MRSQQVHGQMFERDQKTDGHNSRDPKLIDNGIKGPQNSYGGCAMSTAENLNHESYDDVENHNVSSLKKHSKL